MNALIDAALVARARAQRRPRREIAAALAAAATRWASDAALADALPTAAGLSPAMVAAVLPIAAEALDADAMTELVERELGPGAAGRGAPDGPALVVQLLASNVPALALPAIALACLAGVATLVKSGRHDPLSAAAFRRALGAVDPDLAATVVTARWAGGDIRAEDAAFARADRVVATGGDATLDALARRLRVPMVAHGTRVSVAAVGRDAPADAVDGLALDVALHDQRGCLSPHAVWVEGDVDAFAERLAAALDAVARQLPPGPVSLAARAAARARRDAAEWRGARLVGSVIVDPRPALGTGGGLRIVHVHPIASLAALPPLLPMGLVECVGVAGGTVDPAALRARGVARVCPVGRMQRPPLCWPRGQRAPLHSLLGVETEPVLEVER
jgi:hypothetical protein